MAWLSAVLSSELQSGVRKQLLGMEAVRTAEVEARVSRDYAEAGLAALLALSETERLLLFSEVGFAFGNGGSWVVRGGLGMRHQLGDDAMVGINVFYGWQRDRNINLSFRRTSLGAELRTRWLDLSANRYFGLDDPRAGTGDGFYYSADGHDLVARARVPVVDWLEWELSHYRWERGADDTGASESGYKAGVVLHMSKALEFRLVHDWAENGRNALEAQLRMRWDMVSNPLERGRSNEFAVPWSRRYELVRRENRQKIFKNESNRRQGFNNPISNTSPHGSEINTGRSLIFSCENCIGSQSQGIPPAQGGEILNSDEIIAQQQESLEQNLTINLGIGWRESLKARLWTRMSGWHWKFPCYGKTGPRLKQTPSRFP